MGTESRRRSRVLDLCFGTVLVLLAGFIAMLHSGTDGYLGMAMLMFVWVPPFGLGLCMLHAGLRKR